MRSAAGAVISGLTVLLLFSVWLRYPIQLSLAIGANPHEADAAWRAAAPDLLGRPAESARSRSGEAENVRLE